MDWLPVSAAMLVTGALALCLGAFLLPQSDNGAESLRIVQEQGGQWMAAAATLFVSSILLSLGVPAMLTLVQRRGWKVGVVAAVVLEIGFIGTAGFAMLMAFFHALVETGTIRARGIDDLASDTGLAVFLYAWIIGIYLGELLLGIALLRAGTTPKWVPIVLVAHVLTFPISSLLPEYLSKATVLLLVLGFAGVAISATTPPGRPRFT
jgi:hypothetical protein